MVHRFFKRKGVGTMKVKKFIREDTIFMTDTLDHFQIKYSPYLSGWTRFHLTRGIRTDDETGFRMSREDLWDLKNLIDEVLKDIEE